MCSRPSTMRRPRSTRWRSSRSRSVMAATTSPSTRVPSGGPRPRDASRPGAEHRRSGQGQQPSAFSRIFGRQPIGMLLTAPYAIFIAVVFAFPLVFAVWMSFHDYFFTAPGVNVPHPFVGLDNYKTVLTDPAVLASFVHVGDLPDHQCAADGGTFAGAGHRAEPGHPRPHLLPGGLLRPVRDGERRGRRRLAVPVQLRRPGQPDPRTAGARTRHGWSIPRGRCRRSRSS